MDKIQHGCNTILKLKITRLFMAVIFSVLLTAGLTGAAISKYSVIIADENSNTIVFTSESQPEKILEQNQIAMAKHDTFTFSGFEDNKATITLNRAKQVTINADKKVKSLYVVNETVGDALKTAGVTVDDDDFINVSLTQAIKSDTEITINRVDYETVTTVKQVPFEVISFPTQTLEKGKTKTLKAGINGEVTTVTKQKLYDGVVVESTVLSEETTKNAVPARILKGDPSAPTSQFIPDEPIQLDKNGNPVSYKAKVVGKATAYSALGRSTKLVPGCVAMDLSKFPRGTQVYIKTPDGSYTYGYSKVKDTGYAVNDGTILVDLFFNSYKESCLFGAKTVEIYVL